MCAETVWWQCHRRLVADALVVRGIEVMHLMAPGKRMAHQLNEGARVSADATGGKHLVYDVGVLPFGGT